MPTADRRAFVPAAVRAFLDPDYPALELIVVDDGADPVGDLMPADPRVRYVRLPAQLAIGAKRNECVRQAGGDLLLHWDDDDWHAPTRVRRQVEALWAAGADVCGMRRLLFHDPRAGCTWLYEYPAGGPFWAVGGALLYTPGVWGGGPFPRSGRRRGLALPLGPPGGPRGDRRRPRPVRRPHPRRQHQPEGDGRGELVALARPGPGAGRRRPGRTALDDHRLRRPAGRRLRD